MSTAEAKPKKIQIRDLNKKGWPFLSKAEAIKRRWLSKMTGEPTKIYLLALAKAQALKNGEPIPIRSRKSAPEQFHADLQSPYDLRRRSGYKTIWQVLAENANQFVPFDVLHKEVNKRLKKDPTDKTGWYEKNFTSQKKKYDTHKNSIVMARSPYNGVNAKTGEVKPISIEGLKQRVIVDETQGVKLMTNVTEPRQFKKRGRKSSTNQVVEDNNDDVIVNQAEETPTQETANA